MGRLRRRAAGELAAALVVAALVAAACSGSDPDTGIEVLDQSPMEQVSDETDDAGDDLEVLGQVETAADAEDPEGFRLDLPFDPSDIDALVTSTGVPMAVLGVDEGAYLAVAPCGQIVRVQSGQPISGVEVVIDPGHGGPIDTGAVGPGGLVERDINLLVATATEAELRHRGIEVMLTRTDDYAVPLGVRALYADAAGAELMVSIHHNSPSPLPSAVPGADVFVQSESADSARLGGLVREEVVAALDQFEGIDWVATTDSGVIVVLNSEGTDAYGMMAYPATPTALVELSYISNPAEEQLMETLAYRQAMAIALADAVEAYLTTDRPGSGFTEAPRIYNPARAPGAEVCQNPDLG